VNRRSDHKIRQPGVGPGVASRAAILGKSQPSGKGIAAVLRSGWTRGWLFGVLLVAATLAAYQPMWHAGFIWDDDTFLLRNPLIKATDGLFRFWCTTEAPDYFPMTSTTLWLEWRLWGPHPLGYHLVNVLLHAASAVLLWRVLARLKIPGARLAAAIFALHPVNVESVAWITERKNTLAMFFYLLSLLCYVRFDSERRASGDPQPSTLNPQRHCYWLAVGAFALALLSKTAVVMLPLVLLGLVWWRRGRLERREVWRSVPFFAIAGLLGLITVWFQYHRNIGLEVVRSENFGTRLAGAGWAVWFYLYKALWPVNLMFVYPRWQINGANILSYAPGLMLAAVFASCWYYRREGGRALLFGLGYFVVMLLPVLGFLDIYFMRFSLVADHWQYFSLIGVAVLVAAAAARALGRLRKGMAILAPALCVPLLLVLGWLTWRQSTGYTDIETLWQVTLSRNPNAFMVHNNLGLALLQKGQMDEAVEHFQKALALQPGFGDAHNNLGLILFQRGQVDEAIDHFQKALAIHPENAPAHYNLGNALLHKGQLDGAGAQFKKAIEFDPAYGEAHNNLGNVLLDEGKVDEAIIHFQKALELQPDYGEAHNNLAIARLRKGQGDEAIAQFRAALRVQPGYSEALHNLAMTLVRKGQVDGAIVEFQKALAIQPNDAVVQNTLAGLLLQQGRADEALAHFQTAVQIDPTLASAHRNLGTLLLGKGAVDEAIPHYQKALEIQPTNVVILNNLAWILATCPKASLRSGAKALELAQRAEQLSEGRNPSVLETLAAAYAEAGRFPEAVTSARQALELAATQNNNTQVTSLQKQIRLYQASIPFRDTSQTNTARHSNEP
jgi:tetratricopeptide (TPR) repeat protein